MQLFVYKNEPTIIIRIVIKICSLVALSRWTPHALLQFRFFFRGVFAWLYRLCRVSRKTVGNENGQISREYSPGNDCAPVEEWKTQVACLVELSTTRTWGPGEGDSHTAALAYGYYTAGPTTPHAAQLDYHKLDYFSQRDIYNSVYGNNLKLF